MMLLVAGIFAPAASLLYLIGAPGCREKVAVALTFLFGGGTLLWVDWSQVDGRIAVLSLAFLLVPTLAKLGLRR
jgi:hypothetical protein